MRLRPMAALLALALVACGDDLSETKPPEHGADRSLSRAAPEAEGKARFAVTPVQ